MKPETLLGAVFPVSAAPDKSRMVDELTRSFPVAQERFWNAARDRLTLAALEEIRNRLGSDLEKASWVGEEARVERVIWETLRDQDAKSHHTTPLKVMGWIARALSAEVLGLGPIQKFLEDPAVTEVMVNGCEQVFVEKRGRLVECTGTEKDRDGQIVPACRFRDNSHLMHVIHRIVDSLGRQIDVQHPMVDARIKGGPADGARVNAVIPPLAIDGPILTIRKFRKDALTADALVKSGTFSREVAAFLEACVKGKLNIIVSGGTGSGKTTLLNVLSNYIPDGERIITVEDSAELLLQKRHVLRLETKPATSDQKEDFTIRKLVKNTLRMRPDRVVVGECRGEETLDMLQAMNTGHEGCLTTVHANSPKAVISRLETMVLLSGFDLPARAIRQQIKDAIHLIIHTARVDGTRKITAIAEIEDTDEDRITLRELFTMRQHGGDGKELHSGSITPTGVESRWQTRVQPFLSALQGAQATTPSTGKGS